MIDLHPEKCNICGGKVIYTTNDRIYHGKKYGSGYCYLCTECGAYVGTHKPRPKEALGILADEEMREWKIRCHDEFDKLWGDGDQRKQLYKRLSKELNISIKECHFGYFDLDTLKKSYEIIKLWEDDL